ncbi:extracellular solute-binding protein [Paenibacillus flagellatus]|uniref:ABC transporter substrate-binding protein n=1 Tax=Paenibacillus flagellatus TaxID=2211139 RepID=A0A2V5K8F6_9BACL|nr:extracellular solute-binding protein [Paenibacillus flagellatus]PYI55795.1 ABC transporter substrate-binding protein [Paenibacillus flagellatus]
MKKRWKTVSTGTLALLVAASMAACSSGKKEEPGASQPNGQQGDAGAQKKTVTLNWLTYQYGPVDDNAPSKKLLEDKFNVKFNIWYMDVNKREELLGAKIAGGEIPDLMTVYSLADLKKFADQGIITGYTDEELNKYMPNYKKLVDKYTPEMWKYFKIKDKYYGIPYVNIDGQYSLATAWNKTWLDKVGITKVPETLDEFKDAVYKFRNNDPDGNGKKDTYGMSKSAMTDVFGAYGIYNEFWTIRDGKIVWSGVLPEARKALETLAQWKKDDVIDPEWTQGQFGENTGGYWAVSNAFVNGKIGVSTHGSYYHWMPAIAETGSPGGDNYKLFKEATQGKGEIAFGKPPVGPDGKFGNITPGMIGTTSLALGKNANDPEKKARILQIFDALYSDFDLFIKVKYGDKGTMWENGPDGKTIVWKDGYKKNEEQAKFGGGITFTPLPQPEFGQKIQSPKALETAQKLFKFEKAGYENAVKSALPSEPKYYKNLVKLQQETYTAIINGEKPITEFDKFVETWKKEGGDQLTKEANEWYTSVK